MKDRLVPKADYYRTQESISLEQECAEKIVAILDSSSFRHIDRLPKEVHSYFMTEVFSPDEDAETSDEPLPSLRIVQTLSVAAPVMAEVSPDTQALYEETSGEYQVFSIQMGYDPEDLGYPDDASQPDGLRWRDEIALIFKTDTNGSGPDINLISRQTGEDLSSEDLIELSALLSAWEESLRINTFADVAQGNIERPEIQGYLDDHYLAFYPNNYVASSSCSKCSIENKPCSHTGFRHNAN